jgi:hypothetical protein
MTGRTDCNGCKWAAWVRTAAGRLHPSGDGKCEFPYTPRPLPGAFHWPRYGNLKPNIPKPYGGYINRREPLKRPCPYYERGEYQERKPTND